MAPSFYELQCGVNSYPWGKTGKESIAARLCEEGKGYAGDDEKKSQFKIDEKKPYAEMWMGDYPDLPSYVRENGKPLKDVIEEDPETWLGKTTIDKFNNHDIPYLPKVLSIAKALPLQLHPNKELATKLHEEDPQNFTDPNHKPEIALALSKFEAFCGFKPLKRIEKLLHTIPTLQAFLPADQKSFDDKILKSVVNKMLKAEEADIQQVYTEITNTPGSEWGSDDEYIPELAPRLAEQYSNADPGVLVALITMNYLVLEAGESIYIPADGIHAYLAGDIIECMARSNNVLNTGFCPAAERNSADLFCNALTFKPHSAEQCMLPPKELSKHTRLYSPPLAEFDVTETKLDNGQKDELKAAGGSRIIIVTKGQGSLNVEGQQAKVSQGQTFFVKAGAGLSLESSSDEFVVHTFYNH